MYNNEIADDVNEEKSVNGFHVCYYFVRYSLFVVRDGKFSIKYQDISRSFWLYAFRF
ncbi:hypothetical protein GCM10023231_37070 [Olivibacter ginsenosidimutans]|uniref:Uncharacterized protein n=1 Tax=Olivibacter ginsenosidimutans TaxID=1176537 RepID=A0ABP9C4M2_9SPHI